MYKRQVQRYGDFVDGRVTCCEGIVKHSYKPSIKFADLNEVLPEFISDSLKEAIPAMGRKLKGFDSPDALMTGVETRSSSPVRIVRDKQGVLSLIHICWNFLKKVSNTKKSCRFNLNSRIFYYFFAIFSASFLGSDLMKSIARSLQVFFFLS